MEIWDKKMIPIENKNERIFQHIMTLQALFSFAFLFMPGLFINSSMLRNYCHVQ